MKQVAILWLSLVFFNVQTILSSTVLEEAEEYFSDIVWTNPEAVLPAVIPSPFSIPELDTDLLSMYSDTKTDENIFPTMEGIGILDYSNVNANLLAFLNTISERLKNKNIEADLCVGGKEFLPFFIKYRLQNINEKFTSIFYSRAEFISGGKCVTKFRCNFTVDNKLKFMLIELTAAFRNEKWLIDSFDIIGIEDANSFK